MIFWSVDSGKTFQGNCEEIKENTKRKDVFFGVLILGRLFKEIVKKLKTILSHCPGQIMQPNRRGVSIWCIKISSSS